MAGRGGLRLHVRGGTRHLRRLVRLHASLLRGGTTASASLVPSSLLAPRSFAGAAATPDAVVTASVAMRTQRLARAPQDAHAAAAPDAVTLLAAEGARARASRGRREKANRAKGGAPKFGRLAETDRRGVEASPLRRRRRRWWRGRISTSAAAAVTAPRASSCKKLVWGWIFRATARRVFSLTNMLYVWRGPHECVCVQQLLSTVVQAHCVQWWSGSANWSVCHMNDRALYFR